MELIFQSRIVKCPTVRLYFLGGAEMTRYERLIATIADETAKAEAAKKRGDENMERFHRNAAEGFQRRLRSLSLDEAAEIA